MSIWDAAQVTDDLDAIIKSGRDFDLVLAQIPSLYGSSQKATYLGLRAVGLTFRQSLEVLNQDEADYARWIVETPELEVFENECLGKLQSKIGADIIRLGFMRNMTMFMLRDYRTIRGSLIDMEAMSPRDFAYLRAARRFYSNHDLLALEKAIAPEKHRDNVITLNFGEQVFEVVDAIDSGGDHVRVVEETDE